LTNTTREQEGREHTSIEGRRLATKAWSTEGGWGRTEPQGRSSRATKNDEGPKPRLKPSVGEKGKNKHSQESRIAEMAKPWTNEPSGVDHLPEITGRGMRPPRKSGKKVRHYTRFLEKKKNAQATRERVKNIQTSGSRKQGKGDRKIYPGHGRNYPEQSKRAAATLFEGGRREKKTVNNPLLPAGSGVDRELGTPRQTRDPWHQVKKGSPPWRVKTER